MPTSLNLRFAGDVGADDEWPHPPGAAIARLFQAALAAREWTTEDFDNWRDVGWSVRCSRGTAVLEVAIAGLESGEWMLQVTPASTPGLLGRWMGKRASAPASDWLGLAVAIHAVLSEHPPYTGFRWCWDGMPSESNSTTEPRPPDAS